MVKSKLPPRSGCSLRQLNPIHNKGHKVFLFFLQFFFFLENNKQENIEENNHQLYLILLLDIHLGDTEIGVFWMHYAAG